MSSFSIDFLLLLVISLTSAERICPSYDACFQFFYVREVLKIERKDSRKLSAKKPDENLLKN
jgi:hypothetical protein